MAHPQTDEAQLRRVMQILRECDDNQSEAARILGINRLTLVSQRRSAMARGITGEEPRVPLADIIPPNLLPTEHIIAHLEASFEQRKAHASAKLWRKFRVPTSGPYAIMFFGDPHLDDNGCNLPLFKAHAQLAASTAHLYAVNIGDTTNDWCGRLARLWANQDTSAETARAIVKHYLADSGIPWFLWLHGNHDMWDGPVGRDVFERHKPHYVEMEDWQAKITLVSPNGHELRLWAAHNFKGTSQWNPLHGPLKAAQMQDWAHLYVAGHHHNWGLMEAEHEHRRFVYHVARVRGYKWLDDYANQNGFGEQQFGSAMVAVIDPCGDKLSAVKCFHDPFEAVEFLAWKRQRFAAQSADRRKGPNPRVGPDHSE